ncbi:MAG: hypothetical protein QME70_04085 [Bacillota bacterium]|nr:hypothetical protein [Bacillota bacterium]
MDARAIKLAEVSEAAVIVGVDVAKHSHRARVTAGPGLGEARAVRE